jgi:hypothetical protein
MTDFYSQVKSTIDKAGVSIANAFEGGVNFVDLDDTVAVAGLMEGPDTAVVWELLTLTEDPVAPLYSLQFGIGAKTTKDAGNYSMSDLLDAVHSQIKKDGSLDVIDYTPGGDGVTKHGYIYFTDVSVDPQLFDKASGIRLISVTGRAVNNG